MPKAYKTTRIVQFAETDLAGILHFANYYRIMEEAEHAFWRSLGKSVVMRENGVEIGWPRVKTSCEYFAPAHFEDELELSLKVARLGEGSVSYDIEFRRGDELLAVGHLTAACCTMEDGRLKSIPIPNSVRESLADMVAT